jgi:hypothetical protein
MADVKYTIHLLDPDGTEIDIIDKWISLSYNRTVDAIGTLILVLPPTYPMSNLKTDGRLAVYRNGKLDTETIWLIREPEYSTAEDGSEVITVTAYSANYLLTSRVVAYDSRTAQADKEDKADSVMVAYVSENLGSDASDSERDVSDYLDVQASASLGPTVTKECAWDNLFDVLHDVAKTSAEKGSPVHFDVVAPAQDKLEFRTYRGQRGLNHTAASGEYSITLSLDRGSLGPPAKRNFDRTDEVTFVYAAGNNTDSSSPMTASDGNRIGESPFNRREQYVRAGGMAGSAGGIDEAQTAVRAGRPKRVFEGMALDVPGAQYGMHWEFGDKVTAEYAGDSFDVSIDSISVMFVNKEETITARLRAED